MAKWKNTSGAIVEVNDRPESIAAVEAVGWTRVKSVKKKRTKKVAKKK